MMHRFQRERQIEKDQVKARLVVARRELPQCIVLLRSLFEAVNVASSLNTTVATVGSGKEQKESIPTISTPAGAP
jgi:hypothetical protein